jgi:hypothetical protein
MNMGLRHRLTIERLFPFILFRSLAQMAIWLAIVVSSATVASLLVHSRGELQAELVGGIIGSLFTWIPLLPYELRIKPVETSECLVRLSGYLARSNMSPVDSGNRSKIGVEEWIPNRRRLRWKGNEVEILVDGNAVVVRGPRSMIKPLWRNFRGPWRMVVALV